MLCIQAALGAQEGCEAAFGPIPSTKHLCSHSSPRTYQFPGGTAEAAPLLLRLTVFAFSALLTSTLENPFLVQTKPLSLHNTMCRNSNMALSFQGKQLKGKQMSLSFFLFLVCFRCPLRQRSTGISMFGVVQGKRKKGEIQGGKKPHKTQVNISKIPSYYRNDQTQILSQICFIINFRTRNV